MHWAVCDRAPGGVLPISDSTIVRLTSVLLLAAGRLRQTDGQPGAGSDDRRLPRLVGKILANDPLSLAVILLQTTLPNTEPRADDDEQELALGRFILLQFQDCLTNGQGYLPLQLTNTPRENRTAERKRQVFQSIREVFVVQQLARRYAQLNARKALGLIPFAAVATVRRLFFPEKPVDFAATLQHIVGPENHSPLNAAFETVQLFDRWLERLGRGGLEILLFGPTSSETDTQGSLPGRELEANDLPNVQELLSGEGRPLETLGRFPLEEGNLEAIQTACRLARRWRRRLPECRQLWDTAMVVAGWVAALHAHFAESLEKAKLDAMAEFAAGAGHEINNPLAIISGHAQLLLRQATHPEWQRMLATIVSQAQRAHEMIADARLFARPPKPVLASVNYFELLQTVMEEYAPQAAARKVRLELATCPDSLEIFQGQADRSQILTVLGAIVKNALEAVPENGVVSLAIRADTTDVEISIADNGPGISPEVRDHLFDPFYSGRQAGRGLGMGLSKAWRIVTLHGGTIDVQSKPGKETVFRIRLPRYPEGDAA